MKYTTSLPQQAGEALQHLFRLIADGKVVEVKEIKPKRSLQQNAFLHVLLGGFGSHFGWTVEEAKALYKRLPGNKGLYFNQFNDKGVQFEYERSSADLNKEEMTLSIDVLREWSAKMGYKLPTAEDHEWLQRLENEIEKNNYYLKGSSVWKN